MGKALLINPSYFRTYGSNDGGILFPVVPILSMAAIGGSLRDRGHDFTIADFSYRRYDPDLIEDLIRREAPDVVGITATTPLVNQMRDISFLVKDRFPGVLTVGGGAHPSALPRETLAESALDMVAFGEADHVISDLLDGTPVADLDGVYWRDGEEVVANPARPLIEDLDELPMPAWEHYPPECNEKVTRIIARYRPVTTVEFSRGCIYKCDFCASKNTMGKGYRKKSPERCAEELERVARLGFREVILTDDIFTSDNDWAAAVCEAIIAKNPGVAWNASNGIRVDSANPELFRLMKRAGCYRVFFGFESGNEEVLHAFGKGGQASLQKGIEAVDMARKAGLEPDGFFMVGLSGDTEASMQDTIDYAKQVRLAAMKCGLTVPYPGTPMFRALHDARRVKTFDWDQYTVYNQAENIYDHPTLEWYTIRQYFRRFYSEAITRNPGFLWRRLRYGLKNRQLLWSAYYALRFWKTVRGQTPEPAPENYRYADRWRPLDLDPTQALGDYPVPRARGAKVTVGRR